jgi:GNAT superfamily N-acetyltransferase
VAEDPATREIVGVARYVRTADDAATADLAVAVVDAWHRRGVGRRLMTELIRQARGDGVARVMGTTLVDNHPSHGLLRSLGFEPAAFFGDTMDLMLTLGSGAARPAAA